MDAGRSMPLEGLAKGFRGGNFQEEVDETNLHWRELATGEESISPEDLSSGVLRCEDSSCSEHSSQRR